VIFLNPRDLVKNTLNFAKPERIPRQLWTLPWAEARYPEMIEKIHKEHADDIIYAPPYYKEELPQVGEKYKKGIFFDEWGCKFENLQDGIRGEVKDHLIKTWNDIKKIHIPKERLSINIKKINKFCRDTNKFVLPSTIQRPFERMQFLRRTDNLFIDLIEQAKEFKKLIGEIHEFYKEEIRLWCKTDIDGIFLMDDWGMQNSLLINPKLWKKIFKPIYKDYINIAHKNGKYAFMHSDGYTMAIIPELIEIGLDAFNTQLFCMNIEEIGRKFRGKITFWGEIDRQYLLPNGTIIDIDRAVERVFSNLYANGGIIGQCEFGPGAKPENVLEVYKAWDIYKKSRLS